MDATVKKVLGLVNALGGPGIHEMTVEDARKLHSRAQSANIKKHPAFIEDLEIPCGPSGKVSIRIIRPKQSDEILPIIMYFHGGGWVLGNKETHDRLVREIARGVHAAVIFVNFTLSPEARFPLAVEEAYAATCYMVDHAPFFHLDPYRVAVAGDSGGGNMAAVVALLASERGKPFLCSQVLFYPVTDCNFETPSYQEFAQGYLLTRDAMKWFWNHYLPDERERIQALASPLRATRQQMKNLPPALILTAEFDVLRDEGEAYARKLSEAGVPVVSVRYFGTIHDFITMNALRNTTAARSAISLTNSTLRKAFKMPAMPLPLKSASKKDKFNLRKLIDQWTPSVIFLFLFLKVLQLFKKLGFRAKDNGWRAAMRHYARMEYSKFVLAAFRLDFWSDKKAFDIKTADLEGAKLHLIKRFSKFLHEVPELQWQLHWTRYSVRRKGKRLIDIVQAKFNDDGTLESIKPFLDPRIPLSPALDELTSAKIQHMVVRAYNEGINMPDKKRPWILQTKIREFISQEFTPLSAPWREAKKYSHRMISSAFISFQTLPPCAPSSPERFKMPSFIKLKHPGLGLLNICCRFNHTLDEADLWFQFHHIPVDGAPMQEVLNRLKAEWGVSGQLQYPSLKSIPPAIPEISSTGTGKAGMYHLTGFIDFEPFLKTRKKLSEKYEKLLGEDIKVVSLLIWGLAHHSIFKNKKFLFPVDVEENSLTAEDRATGVVLIRPQKFFNPHHPEKGFLNFQREFNRRLDLARKRQGESHEMFELYALTNPFFYELIRNFFPRALEEFIGTVGVTMLKDSDFFLTPMSEAHIDGFLAFSNFSIPTEDGGFAGSVSVRGKRQKIIEYLVAVKEVTSDFSKYFNYVG